MNEFLVSQAWQFGIVSLMIVYALFALVGWSKQKDKESK